MFLYQIHFNIVFALHLDHTGGLCHSLFQLKFCMPFRTCTVFFFFFFRRIMRVVFYAN